MSNEPMTLALALAALKDHRDWDTDPMGGAMPHTSAKISEAIDCVLAHTAQPSELDEAKERENIAQAYGVPTNVTHNPEWRHTVDVWIAAKRHAASVGVQQPVETCIHGRDNCRKQLNRRATVEAEMFDCVSGKAPMPDKERLRAWAMQLGVPEEFTKRVAFVPQPSTVSVAAQEQEEPVNSIDYWQRRGHLLIGDKCPSCARGKVSHRGGNLCCNNCGWLGRSVTPQQVWEMKQQRDTQQPASAQVEPDGYLIACTMFKDRDFMAYTAKEDIEFFRREGKREMIPFYKHPPAPSREVPEWQPIETAPENEIVLISRWSSRAMWIASRHGDEWILCGDEISFDTEPTHWMPLPAAPAATEEGA